MAIPFSYLHSSLSEVDPASQIFSDESIGVVCPLKHSLQSLELAAVEGGPVPALLSLLLLLCVHLFICTKRRKELYESEEQLRSAQALPKKSNDYIVTVITAINYKCYCNGYIVI